ncbi:MAG: hypothetical protein ABSG19_02875 [Candidatus Aminicenantales bacterium]
MTEQAQNEYYQAIAREFLRRRGAPFLLSARDVAVIAEWEKNGVPLGVVMEGIGRAFDGIRDRSRGTKGLSLSFCDSQVRKALAQHADRAAGRRKPPAPRSAKVNKALKEIARCLRSLPPGDLELRPLLEAACGLLAEAAPDEEALEKVDDQVDAVLWGRVPASERDALKRQMAADLAGLDRAEGGAAVRTRLIKSARQKQKVPHVSLFYY